MPLPFIEDAVSVFHLPDSTEKTSDQAPRINEKPSAKIASSPRPIISMVFVSRLMPLLTSLPVGVVAEPWGAFVTNPALMQG